MMLRNPKAMKITLFAKATGGAMPTTIKPHNTAQTQAIAAEADSETFGWPTA